MNAVLARPTPLMAPTNTAMSTAVAALPGTPPPFAALLAVSETALSRLDAAADTGNGDGMGIAQAPPANLIGAMSPAAPNTVLDDLARRASSGASPAAGPAAPTQPRPTGSRGEKTEASLDRKKHEDAGSLSPGIAQATPSMQPDPLMQPAPLTRLVPTVQPPLIVQQAGLPAVVAQVAAPADRGSSLPCVTGAAPDAGGTGDVPPGANAAPPQPVAVPPFPAQREAPAGNRPLAGFGPEQRSAAAASAIANGMGIPRPASPPPGTDLITPEAGAAGLIETSPAISADPSSPHPMPAPDSIAGTVTGFNSVPSSGGEAVSAPPATGAGAGAPLPPSRNSPAGITAGSAPQTSSNSAARPGTARPQPPRMPATAEAERDKPIDAPHASLHPVSVPEPGYRQTRQEGNPDQRDRPGSPAQRTAPETTAPPVAQPEQVSISYKEHNGDRVPERTDSSGPDLASSPAPPPEAPISAAPSAVAQADPAQVPVTPGVGPSAAMQPRADTPVQTAPLPTSSTAPEPRPDEQIGTALVGLGQSGSGSRSMTLHLRPTELGAVQIRIDRAHDMPARVDIAVQEPRTLALLVRDEARLSHTLDQAGVPREGRVLTIHLAGPDAAAQTSTLSNQSPNNSFPSGTGSGNPGPGGGSARQSADTRQTGQDDVSSTQSEIRAPWRRAGLDITA
jgi:flagellar hook-length control protein FliK